MTPASTSAPVAVPVDLVAHRNNAAFWAAGTVPAEGFDGYGRAYPVEELGPLRAELGLPPDCGHGALDNVACEGQVLTLDRPLAAVGLQVVGAAAGGPVSETVRLLPPVGEPGPVVEFRVEVSDFLSRRPVFQDGCFATAGFLYDVGGRPERSVQPRLWRSLAEAATPVRCGRIELPVNPDLHVVGLWLLSATTDGG